MGVNRVTNSILSNRSVFHLQNNLSRTNDLQEKLASGQNILKPSDDPVGLTRVLLLSNSIRTDEQYKKNIDAAISETQISDSAITTMVDVVHRVQELATQAANFTNNQDGRDAIALEVDELINQLVQLGNTDIAGKYVFAGFQTDTPPFTRTGDNITYAGSPPTSAWQRSVELSDGVTTPINVNGQNLLGSVTVTAGGPPLPPTFAAGSGGLFETMIELKIDLQTAGDPNQLAEIRSRIDDLTTDMNTLLNSQAVLGSISSRLELTSTRIDDRSAILTQEYSGIQDVDLPTVISDLQQQQNVLDASLSVAGRVLTSTILNYI
ncbi:MAG: flagellar hook-associated protein FlgL [Cyanobacteria bacterium P01_H01_bin.74]